MTRPTLVLGNKRYSSWSLRPWLAMTVAGVDFAEEVIPLYLAESQQRLAALSPTGQVPVLHDGGAAVWDSLAICETVAESRPGLWPVDPGRRARARSISAEMHAGFAALRTEMPMNLGRTPSPVRLSDAARANVARVQSIWAGCRAEAADGPFLFGAFSIADAMYAPVVARFRVYAVDFADAGAAAWADTIWRMPEMEKWRADAAAEPWIQDRFEI